MAVKPQGRLSSVPADVPRKSPPNGSVLFPNPFAPGPVTGDPLNPLGLPTARERVTPVARRPSAGTRVTVRAYDIPGVPGPHEHMYVEYDDGNDQLIARAGPSSGPGAFLGKARIDGRVTPATASADYARGGRVVDRGFVPGATAHQAAAPARVLAAELEREPRRYVAWSRNSNSYAADVAEPIMRRRPGDALTPGARTRLRAEPVMPPPLPPFGHPLDLLFR